MRCFRFLFNGGSSVLCLLLAACQPPRSASGEKHALVGAPAPEFDLPAQAGGDRASLVGASGKVAIVDFWATWCEPCRQSFPKYQALSERFSGRLFIVGISEDDKPDGIADFAQQTGARFTLAWDGDKALAGRYQPGSMPTSFVLDANGLVRYVHSGYRDGDEQAIESEIQELLQ